MKSPKKRLVVFSLAVTATVLSPGLMLGDTVIYQGPGGSETSPVTGTMNNDVNWTDSLAPSSSLDTTLAFGGSAAGTYTATNDFSGDFNLNRILLNSSSSGLTTITSGSFNFLNDSGAAGPRITQDGSGPVTINSGIKLANSVTIDGAGTGQLTLGGTISGAGGLLINHAAGVTLLSVANSYVGGTTLTAGTLQAGINTAFGTGALALNGGRLSSDSTAARTLSNVLSIGGNVALGDVTKTGTLTLSGVTTLGTANAILTTDSAVTLSGIIGGGANGFTKSGAGTLNLTNGNNTYTGLTTVNEGMLTASATGVIKGNVLVTDSGTLRSTVANNFGTTPTSTVTVLNGGNWTLASNFNQAVNKLVIGSPSDTAGTASRVEIGNDGGNAVTLQITGSGANVLNLQGSAITPAVLSLGGYGLGIGTVQFTNTSPGITTTVNLGANGQIHSGGTPAGSGNGALYSTATTTASNYVSFNFNGTTISTQDYTGAATGPGSLYYNLVRVGDTNGQTAGYFDNVNINASLGDGTGQLQVVKSNINLGWTGSINLGALVAARDSGTGTSSATASTTNSNPITVASTATGMTGGVIYGAGTASIGPGTSSGITSLTFAAAGAPQTFTFGTSTSGLATNVATIDVRTRNTAAGAGTITQNNISLAIDGGILRGNLLAASSSTITISNGGELTLSNDTAAYTISTTAVGADNRTIFMNGSGAGTFTLGGTGTSLISIGTQTGGGTWSGGIINASGGHTINDGAGGLTATTTAGLITGYTIAANSGLNGLAMNNASPFATSASGVAPVVRMTLGNGSTFFAKNSATSSASATYYIGESSTLSALTPTTNNNVGIATAATGDFMFGFSQANNTQASLGASALSYAGGTTASLTLPSSADTYGLSVGGVLILNSTSGTNSAYYNGTFVITGISGNTVTFALNILPPDTTLPATSSANIRKAQNLVLLRDKGSDDISLLNNALGGTAHIATNQTGTGNLYINSGTITLDTGTTFGGSGGIYSGSIVDGSGWTNLGGNTLGNGNLGAFGSVNGSANGNTLLIVNGELGTSSGDNITISLNSYVGSSGNGGSSGIVIGETASLKGTQNWNVAANSTSRFLPLFDNNLTDASRWGADVSLTAQGQYGLIEASTNTVNPTTSSNYKFTNLLLAGVGGSHLGVIKLTNNVQNDGGSGKEALYAGTFGTTYGDGSGGTVLFNLNGQDLYFDSFTPTLGKALSFINDAANSTSVIRNLVDPATSGPLVSAGFRVLNGATLETQAGDWYSMAWQRNVGTIVADTAAAPNGALGDDVKRTLLADNTSTSGNGASSFTSFLGSGTATGGNTGTTGAGTDGTFRVIGGKFQASNYILNPVGSNGTIDTTGGSDTTLNDVIIRGNASQAVTATNGSTFLTLGTEQLYSVGDVVQFSGTSAGFIANTIYYVVGVNGNQVQVSTIPGGAAQASAGALSSNLQDPTGAGGTGSTAATPALIAAGNTTIIGNLILANAPNASNQATLRVGGIDPTTGLAHASQATLNVVGNLTVGATNNLAIQSNATVKVGGNVDIRGVGSNVTATVNGVTATITGTGVGINAASHFTLNGNTGAGSSQTIKIVPTVGNFHVGDGSAGTLTGTAAQAKLTANLGVVTSADINGATSRLDLNGFNLTAGGTGLTVGGILASTDKFTAGTVTGDVTFTGTATASFNLDGVASALTDYDQINVTGAFAQNGTLLLNIGSVFLTALQEAPEQTAMLQLIDAGTLSGSFMSITLAGNDSGTFAGETLIGASGIQYNYDSLTGSLTVGMAVPEPASCAALAALAVGGIAMFRRRRRV